MHFFVSKALPFGSAASVLHFNRLSRLFWRLGLEVGLLWANFYDDYPAILETSTVQALSGLERLTDFGVEVDTSAACDNLLAVRNKEGRTSEVIAVLQEFCPRGACP